MSAGTTCTVREHRPDWVVTMRRHNRSAFRGYRETPSAYSEVTCPHDLARWRTRAAYVDQLPDADLEQVRQRWAQRHHPPGPLPEPSR